ncbi:MAG TPA: GTP-binding protein, partial [Oxalicibacterium sp.]|nr:GTP-binding protein [Oxalicibacterium sp.]
MSIEKLRNIAIVAHVDHGKTTLVDCLLKQSGTLSERTVLAERVMDSNDQEKERGITILAKNTAITWQGNRINIVDTPGHADFGGEVERVLSMVDSVLLLVDAQEGPMPQTRFVTRKALALGLKPIVVVNKIDRENADPQKAVNATFELFDKLGATDEQLDFPIVYASGFKGYAGLEDTVREGNMEPLFDAILEHVPAREDDPDGPLQLQITSLEYSSYVGKIGVGRILRGRIKPLQDVVWMNGPEDKPTKARINQVLTFKGLDRVLVDEALAGDIVLINGIEEIGIGSTICAPDTPDALPMLKIDEPTLT